MPFDIEIDEYHEEKKSTKNNNFMLWFVIIFTMFIITNANVYGNEYAKNYGIFAALGGSIFSVSLSIGVILLEIIVAFIQAYVFALLTAVYIGMAVNVDH